MCFLLVFILVSAFLIAPYLSSETFRYQDAALRQELAGDLNFLVIGASHGLQAFVPCTLDESLGCSSYNLSHSMMTLDSKEWMLRNELSRNPVETGVLELSNDTLSRDENSEYALGDDPVIGRADSWRERFDYIFHHVGFNDLGNLYSREILHGFLYWMHTVTNRGGSAVDYEAKGFCPEKSEDMRPDEQTAVQEYNSRAYTTDFSDRNVEKFVNIVNLCHQYGARVIIAVVPISDRSNWRYDGCDSFLAWSRQFAKENNCEFYDFNLLKDRYSLFSDEASFQDVNHLCESGAQIFTGAFADIIKKTDRGEDVSRYFYNSYTDMKADSPYMKYLP